MSEMIVKSRVRQRKTPVNIISRNRLISLLDENSSKSLLIVLSPAGYGKTTLVLDFLNGKSKNYGWFQAEEDTGDIYSFITYIIFALKNVKEDFGENTLLLIRSLQETGAKGDQAAIKEISATLINEFYNYFDSDVFLVIDDLQNIINNDWLTLFFDIMLTDIPENLHIIITSREIVPFSISRLEAKRKVFTITQNDLEFRTDEIKQVVNDIYSTKIDDDKLKFLETGLKGWVTGVHLVIQASGTGDEIKDYDVSKAKDHIFDYFANDIFMKLEDETKDFLLKTSLLSDFTPVLAENVLGLKGAENIIRSLISRNLFIEKRQFNETGENIYAYHNLFRDYLRKKFDEEFEEHKRTEFINELSDKLISINEPEQAAEFLYRIKNYEKYVTLILDNYQTYTDNNRDDILWKWTERLPAEIVQNNAELLFIRGYLYKRYIGDLSKSAEYLKQAAEKAKEYDILIRSNLEYALLLLSISRLNDAVALLEKLLPDEKNKIYRAKTLFVLADAYHRLGYNIESKLFPLTNEALEISEEENLTVLRMNLYDLLGRAYQARGIFVKSAYYYEMALKNTTLIYHKLRILGNTIVVYCDTGNFEKAFALLKEVEEIVERFPAPVQKFNLLRSKAVFYFDIGDFDTAREYFEQIIKISTENDHKTYLMWYYLQMGDSYNLQNDPEKAKSYYDIAAKYMDKLEVSNLIEFEQRRLLSENDPVKFETELLKILKIHEEQNYGEELASGQFYLANHYYTSKQYSSCAEYLRKALDILDKNQLVSIAEIMFRKFRCLFDFAVANNIHTKFIRELTFNLLDRVNAGYITPEFKKKLNADIPKLYDIEMKCFGVIEIYVRGKFVQDDKWTRKVSRQIFLYLLLNPDFKFTKDKIMDMFFPDSNPATADNIFHQVITNMRNITKIDGIPDSELKRKKNADYVLPDSPFIIYEDKILRLNENYFYRIDALEFDRNYRIYRSSESNTDEKIKAASEAVNIYRGELLAGIYETWCEDIRETYYNKFIVLCGFLSEIYMKRKMYYEAIEYGEKLLVYDKLNEKGFMNIIKCYIELGNTISAKGKYQQFINSYKEEYGESLPKDIRSELENILKDH